MRLFQNLQKETRILFGAFNPQSPSISIPFSIQNLAVNSRILIDPSFTEVFQPISELYYDGPMGGYGANLKSRTVGYSVSSFAGIRRTLDHLQINVPLLSSASTFQSFVQETPMMTRRVALVAHGPVMRSPLNDVDAFDEEIYAVIYEKREQSDVLVLYSFSAPMLEPHLDLDTQHIQSYFPSKLTLLIPDEIRLALDLYGLYAIEDAKRLTATLKSSLTNERGLESVRHDSPISSGVEVRKFHLDQSFSYDNEALMQAHFCQMIGVGGRDSALDENCSTDEEPSYCIIS